MNEVTIMPNEMRNRDFFCHTCGEKLIPYPKTRTVKRGDSDYKRYRSVGRLHLIGDIEMTEYDFKCMTCNTFVAYDDQCAMEQIQKSVGTLLLSQEQIMENEEKVKIELAHKRKKKAAIGKVVQIAVALLIIASWVISENCSAPF